MKAVEEHELETPAYRRSFWITIKARWEKIRHGRAGRVIGYFATFTVFILIIFAAIMIVGYHTK